MRLFDLSPSLTLTLTLPYSLPLLHDPPIFIIIIINNVVAVIVVIFITIASNLKFK